MSNNENKYPSQLQDKFNLRFPDGMRDVIADRAKQNGRSMNSEIIARLNATISYDDYGRSPSGFQDVREVVLSYKSQVEEMSARLDDAYSKLEQSITLDKDTVTKISEALEQATIILKYSDKKPT